MNNSNILEPKSRGEVFSFVFEILEFLLLKFLTKFVKPFSFDQQCEALRVKNQLIHK